MLRSDELAKARSDLEATLTDRCDIVSDPEGWGSSGSPTTLATSVPVRLARSGATPLLTPEGDRIDPNKGAVASLPASQAVEPGNILVLTDGSRYRVAGIYPQADAFRFLKRVAVEWA